MILIIDNYDSFVYNLYQYAGSLGFNPAIYKNNKISIQEIKKLNPEKIILSPGPGNPKNKRDFGVCSEILSSINDIPILGVCLGHQGIISHFGGSIVKNTPMHGKISKIKHSKTRLFNGLESPLTVMRYHSLVGINIPDCLTVDATSIDDNVVMAVSHKDDPIYGVQFHPESIMSENGKKIIQNFLEL